MRHVNLFCDRLSPSRGHFGSPSSAQNLFLRSNGLPKDIGVFLHTRLAAVTHLAVGEFLQEAVNREGFLTLGEGTRIPLLSKKTEIKSNAFK
jgi:hypothetical protein